MHNTHITGTHFLPVEYRDVFLCNTWDEQEQEAEKELNDTPV